MKPLTWKREAIGVTEAAWVARHKEGDVEFELYVSDGPNGEPGLCDSDPSESVWHAWLACGDDVEQADVWMDETGCGPTNLPEACARAAQYLLDEMTPPATETQISLARTLSIIDDTEVSVDDDARAYSVEDGFYVSSWLFVPDAETCGLCQSKDHGDDECPHDDEATELVLCEGCDAPSTCFDADGVPLCAACASAMRDPLGLDPEFPISSRGSASEVACEVCDAVDHATEAHAAAGGVT